MGFFDFFNSLFNKPKPIVNKQVPVPMPSNVEVTPQKTLLDLSKVKYVESPNKSERKDQIRGIVLHHTGPGSLNGLVSWLTNPDSKLSAHYIVGLDGSIVQMVNTQKSAWQAGVSAAFLDGENRKDLNNCTIGIEICNNGVLDKKDDGKFYYEVDDGVFKEWKGTTPINGSIIYPSGKTLEGYFVPYPDTQINAVVELCKALVNKYPQIGKEDMLTHYGIATPEGRKNDPFGLDVQNIVNKIFGS